MINWNDAPEWARYVAQDVDGRWFWYKKKPRHGEQVWYSEDQSQEIKYLSWTDSLQERPHD